MFMFILSIIPGELEYSINKINTIFCLCLFVDNPKKKKNYNVLELDELEYLRKKKKSILLYNGTRAWYTRVLCCMVLEFTMLEYHIIFFLICPISTSVVPWWQNFQELEFKKLEYHKKWYFPKQFRNSVFLQKISEIGGIWPFWPIFNIFCCSEHLREMLRTFGNLNLQC